MHPSYPYIFDILRQSLFPADQTTAATPNTTNSVQNTECIPITSASESGSSFNINNNPRTNTQDSDQAPDWPYIYTELQSQAVTSLAYLWLKTHKLPDKDQDIQHKWLTSCLQQQARWIQVMHAQDQLINLMEQHNIPCVVIKGAAAMMYYPHPSMRAAGDIDFLVKREDYDKAAGILENNGYQLAQEKKTEKHHYGYEKNGISFELHKRLGIIKDTDEELLSLFEKGITNREWHTIWDCL